MVSKEQLSNIQKYKKKKTNNGTSEVGLPVNINSYNISISTINEGVVNISQRTNNNNVNKHIVIHTTISNQYTPNSSLTNINMIGKVVHNNTTMNMRKNFSPVAIKQR